MARRLSLHIARFPSHSDKAVASAASRSGYLSAAVDADYDAALDVLTPLGFLYLSCKRAC